MGTVIRLDASAVDALFPPGSEQRVELTKNVVRDICAHAIKYQWKGAAEEAMRTVRSEARAVVDPIIKEALGAPSGLYNTKLNDAAVQMIREAVRKEILSTISDAIKAEHAKLDIPGRVLAGVRLAVSEAVMTEARALVKSKMEAAMKAVG